MRNAGACCHVQLPCNDHARVRERKEARNCTRPGVALLEMQLRQDEQHVGTLAYYSEGRSPISFGVLCALSPCLRTTSAFSTDRLRSCLACVPVSGLACLRAVAVNVGKGVPVWRVDSR